VPRSSSARLPKTDECGHWEERPSLVYRLGIEATAERLAADRLSVSAVRPGGGLDCTLIERKDEEGSLRVSLKGLDLCALIPQEAKDCLRPGITNRQPDDLRRSAVEETELSEVVVLGDDRIGL
jgi:hypothetical protein